MTSTWNSAWHVKLLYLLDIIITISITCLHYNNSSVLALILSYSPPPSTKQ